MNTNILSYLGVVFFDLPLDSITDPKFRCVYHPSKEAIYIRESGMVARRYESSVGFLYNPITDMSYNIVKVPTKYMVSFLKVLDGKYSACNESFKKEVISYFPEIEDVFYPTPEKLKKLDGNKRPILEPMTEMACTPSQITGDLYFQINGIN